MLPPILVVLNDSSYILDFHRCDLTQILRIRRAVCLRVLEIGLVPAAVFGNRGHSWHGWLRRRWFRGRVTLIGIKMG